MCIVLLSGLLPPWCGSNTCGHSWGPRSLSTCLVTCRQGPADDPCCPWILWRGHQLGETAALRAHILSTKAYCTRHARSTQHAASGHSRFPGLAGASPSASPVEVSSTSALFSAGCLLDLGDTPFGGLPPFSPRGCRCQSTEPLLQSTHTIVLGLLPAGFACGFVVVVLLPGLLVQRFHPHRSAVSHSAPAALRLQPRHWGRGQHTLRTPHSPWASATMFPWSWSGSNTSCRSSCPAHSVKRRAVGRSAAP